MLWADPPFVTGLEDDPEALQIWREIFERFGGVGSSDPEFLFVGRVMSTVTPWALGDEAEWTRIASELDRKLRLSDSSGVSPRTFEGRGEYGRYFSHQLSTNASSNTFGA
jgi:hypothetical protein